MKPLFKYFSQWFSEGSAGDEEMERMILEQLLPRGISDPRVLDAIKTTDRRLFISEELRSHAFADSALLIDCGQTISMPYIVASMTEYLSLQPKHRVLEIGTGSGYQTAILAKLCREVLTIERWAPLTIKARDVHQALGLRNIRYFVGDGSRGVSPQEKFDRVIVTAAAEKIRGELLDQLVDGGICVAPEHCDRLTHENNAPTQMLRLWKRQGGDVLIEDLYSVRFVPLVESPETS